MNLKKVAFLSAAVGLVIDFALVTSVVLNLAWVKTWAAGGQYTTFPNGVRFMYLFQVGFVLFAAWFLWKIRTGVQSDSDSRLALAVICIYAISAASQLFSRSSNERLNVIPAIAILWGFYELRKS